MPKYKVHLYYFLLLHVEWSIYYEVTYFCRECPIFSSCSRWPAHASRYRNEWPEAYCNMARDSNGFALDEQVGFYNSILHYQVFIWVWRFCWSHRNSTCKMHWLDILKIRDTAPFPSTNPNAWKHNLSLLDDGTTLLNVKIEAFAKSYAVQHEKNKLNSLYSRWNESFLLIVYKHMT